MKIKTIILLCLLTQVLQNHGLVLLKKSLSTSDSPLLMKILQSVDAATSDEHLLDVTIKLLKSLCVCMRETLRAKEEKFTEDNSLLELGESSSTDWKVLELYRKIYNNTCFNLKQELINRTHQSKVDEETFLNHSNCGKDERNNTHDTPVVSDKPELIEDNAFISKLHGILFKTLIETKDLHKYNLKRYNLYGKGNPHTRSTLKHNIIVILTLHPDSKETPSRKSMVPEEDFNETLHTNSPIDIDIIDTKYDKREDDITKPETLSDCNLQSLYNFLAVSDKQNLTKVFKFIRKRDYVKIYIEIYTGPNHTDYINVCCDNGTIIPQCNKDLINNSDVDTKALFGMQNDTKTAHKKLVHSYRNTITKIKHLVNLYENTKLRPGEGDTNSTDEGHDHDENTNSQTQSSTQQIQMKNNENDINKLVSNSDDPLKLGEVTRAILLLNNFVSKRTTKKYVSMDQDYTTDRNRIYYDDQWQNMVSKHFQGQDVTTSIFSYYTDPQLLGSDLNKYTEELEHLLKSTKPEWLAEINASTVTNFPSVIFTPEALKEKSLLPSIISQENVNNNAITIDSTITDKDVVKNTNPFITDIYTTTATKLDKVATTLSPLLDTNEVNVAKTTQIHDLNSKLQFDYLQDKQNTIDYEINENSQIPQLITSNVDTNSGTENYNSTQLVNKYSTVAVSTFVKLKHVTSKEYNAPTEFIKASEETHLTSENVVLLTTINSEKAQSQSTEQKINKQKLHSKVTFNVTDVKINSSRSLIPKLVKEPVNKNSISNEIEPGAFYNGIMKYSKTKMNTTQTDVLDNLLENTKSIGYSNATKIDYYQGSLYDTKTTTRGVTDNSTIIPPVQNNIKPNSVKSDIIKTNEIFAERTNKLSYIKQKDNNTTDKPYLTTTANRSTENSINQIEAYNDVTSDVLADFIDKVKPHNDYDNNVTQSNIFKTTNAIGLETTKNQNSKTKTPINFRKKSQSSNSNKLSGFKPESQINEDINEPKKDIITNNFLAISKKIRKELKIRAESFSLNNRTDIEKTLKKGNIESIPSRAKAELSKTLVKDYEPESILSTGNLEQNDKKNGFKHSEEIDRKMANHLNTAINENIMLDTEQINSLLFTNNDTKSNQTIQLNSNPISIFDIEAPMTHKLSETIAIDDQMSDKALHKNSEVELMKNDSNTSAVDHKTEGMKLTTNSHQTKTEKFNINGINNNILLEKYTTYSDVNFNKHNTEPKKIIKAAEDLKALKKNDVSKQPKHIGPIRKSGVSYDIDALQRYTEQIDNVNAIYNVGLAVNSTLPSELHATIKSKMNRSEHYSKLGMKEQHDLNKTKSFNISKPKSWEVVEILNASRTVDDAENLSMRPFKENTDITIKNNILNKFVPRYAVEGMVNYNFVTSVNSRTKTISNIDSVKSFTKSSLISSKNDIVKLEKNDLDRTKSQNVTLETLININNVTNTAVTEIKRRSRTNVLPTNTLSPTSVHEPSMDQFVDLREFLTTKTLKSANFVEDTSPVLSAPFLQTKRIQSGKINEFATYETPVAGKSNTQNFSNYVKASESNIYVNTEIRSKLQNNTNTTIKDITETNLSVPNIMNMTKRNETTHTNDDFTNELINVMQIRDWTASTSQLLKPASSVSTHTTLKTDSIALNNTKNKQSKLDTASTQILNTPNFETVTVPYTLSVTLAATELYLHTNVPYASPTQIVNHENNENTKSLINIEQTDQYAVLNPKQVFTKPEKQFLKTKELDSNKLDYINFENSSTDMVPVKSQLLTDIIDKKYIEKSETISINTLITLQPAPGTEVNTKVSKNTESFTGAGMVDSATEKIDFKRIQILKSKKPVAFELSIKVGVEASKNGIEFSVLEEKQNLKNMSDKNIQSLPNMVTSQVSLNPLQKTPAVDENSKEMPISAINLDKLIEIIDSKIPQANDSSFSNTNITRKSNVFKNEGDYLNEMFSMIDKPSWNPPFKAKTIIKRPEVETVTVTNEQLNKTITHQQIDNINENNATTVKTSTVENDIRKVKHKSMIPGILTQEVGFDKMKVMYKQRIQEFKDSLKNKNVSIQNILSKRQETKETTELNENIKFHKDSMLNATFDNTTDNDLSLEIFDESVITRKPNKTNVRNKKMKKILNKLLKGRKLSKTQLENINKMLKKNDTSTKKQRKGFSKKEDRLNSFTENLTQRKATTVNLYVMPLTSEQGILDISQNVSTTLNLNSVKGLSNNATFANDNSKLPLIVQIEKPATEIPDVFHTDLIHNRRISIPHSGDYVQHEQKQGSNAFTSRLTSQNLATEPRPVLDETLNGIPKATSTFTRQHKSDAYNQSESYLELTATNSSTTKNLFLGMKLNDIKEVENSIDYPENRKRSNVSGTFITNMQTRQDNLLNTSTVSNDTRRKSHFTAFISERKTVKDTILFSSINNGLVRNTIFDKETLLTNKHKHSGKKDKKIPHITINISVPFSAMNTDLLTRNVVSDYLGNNYTIQDHTVNEHKLNNYNASKNLINNKHVKHRLNENTKTSITVSSTPNYSVITLTSDRNSSINDSDANQSLRTTYPDDLKQKSVIIEEILENINDVQDNVDKLILTLNDTTAMKLYNLNKTTSYIKSNFTKLNNSNEQYNNISTPVPWIRNITEIQSHITDIKQMFKVNFNITQLNSKIADKLKRKTLLNKSTAKIESDFVVTRNMQTTPILPDVSTNIKKKDGLAEILDTINYVQDNVNDFILTINDTDITKKYMNKNSATTVGNFEQYAVTESKPSVRRYVLPAIRLQNITKPLFHKINDSMNTTDFSHTLGNKYNSEAELLDELEDIMVQDTFYTTPPYANINLSATNTVPKNLNNMATITERSSASNTPLTNSTALTLNYESDKGLMGIPFSLNESALKYTEENEIVKDNLKRITTIPQRINTGLFNVTEDLNKGPVKLDFSKVSKKASIKLYNHTLQHSDNLGTVMNEALLSSTTAVENYFLEKYNANLNEDTTTGILHEITTNLNCMETNFTEQFNKDIKTNQMSKTTGILREPTSKINNIFNNFTVKNSKNFENINKSTSVLNAFATKMKNGNHIFTEQIIKNKTTQNPTNQTKSDSDSHYFLSEPISIGKYLQINQLTTEASKLLTEESKWVLYKENLLYNELNTKTTLQSTGKIREAATKSSNDIRHSTKQYNDATLPNTKILTTSINQNEIDVSKPISIGKYLKLNEKTTEDSTILTKESIAVGNKETLFGRKNTTTTAMQNITYLYEATQKTNNITNTFKSQYHEHATSQNPNSQIVSVYDDDHFVSEPISIGKYLHINEKPTEGPTTLVEESMSVHNYGTVTGPGLTTRVKEQESIDFNEATTKSNYLNANVTNQYDNATMKNHKNETILDHNGAHFVSEPISIGKYLQINEITTESFIKLAEETRTISYKENIMGNPSITQTSVPDKNLTIISQNNSAVEVDITSSLSPLAIKDDETSPKVANTFTSTNKTFGDVISQLYFTNSKRTTTNNKFTTVSTSSFYLNDLNHKNSKHQTHLTVNVTDVKNLYDNKQVTVYDARAENPFSTPSNSSAEEITPVPTKVWSNTSFVSDKGLIIPTQAIENDGNPVYTSDLETFKEQSYDKFSDYTDTSNETQNKIISNEPKNKEEIPNALIIETVLTKNTSEKSVLQKFTDYEQVAVSIKPSTKPYLRPNVNTYTNKSEEVTLSSVTTLTDFRNATIIFDRTLNTPTHLTTGNVTKSLNIADTTNKTVDKPNHLEIGSLLSPLILTAEEKDSLHFEELLNNDDVLIHIPTTPDVNKNKKLTHTSKNLMTTELPIDHSTKITSNQEILPSTPSIVSKSLSHIFTPAVTMPTLINYDSEKMFDLISANEKDIDDLNEYFNKTDTNNFEENTYSNQTHSIDTPDKENITEEQNYSNIDISFFTLFQSTLTTGLVVNSTTNTAPSLNNFAKISDYNAHMTTISSPEVQLENVDIYLSPLVTYKADITMKIPMKDNYTNSLDEKMYTENNLDQDKYSQKKALGLPSFQDITTIRDPMNEHNNEKYTSVMKIYPDRVTMDPAKTIVNSYIEDLSDELFENKNIHVENQSINISTEHNRSYQPEFKGINKASSIKTNDKSDTFLMHTTNLPPDKQDIDVTTSTAKTSIIPIKLKAIDTTFLGSKIYILDPYTMQNILNRGIEKNKKHVNLSTDNIFTKTKTLINYNNTRSSTENTVSVEAVTSSGHDILTTNFLPVGTQKNKFTNSIELSDAKNKPELESSKHMYTEGTTHRTNTNLNPKSTTNSNGGHNTLDSYIVIERVKSIKDRCGSYNTLKENSSLNSKEIICKNNKTNINFVIKLGTAKKNISYIHTPKLSKIKVTKLKPVNATNINMKLDKNKNHLHGAESKLIEVKSGTKFDKKVEDTYNSNFQELLTNVQNGRLRGENDMNVISFRMQRPDTIRAYPATVTKNIRYNTYQPTTKEDLELLKFDSKPIFNTLLYKKVDEKPHYQPQGHNNSCILIESLKNTFHSKNEFIAVLKAANCSEETLRQNQNNKKPLLTSVGLKHSSSPKELTKNTRLTTGTTRNVHTNGTLMNLIMELNKNFPDETVNKHQITREINRKPPLLNFYKNLQSKLIIGTKLPKNNNALSIGADYNRDVPPFTGVNRNSPLWSNSNLKSPKSAEIYSNLTDYTPRLRTVLDHNNDLLSKLKLNKNLPSRNFPNFSDDSFEVIKDTALPKDNKNYSDPIFDTPSIIFPDTEDSKNLLSIMDFNISGPPIKKENMISHSVFDTFENPKQTIDIHKNSIPTKTKYLNVLRVFPHKLDIDKLFSMSELNVSTSSFRNNTNTLSSSSGILRNSQEALEISRKLHPTQDESTNFVSQVEGSGHILFPMVDFNASATLIKHQDSKYSYTPFEIIKKFQHSIELNKDVRPSNNYNVNLLPQKGDDRNLLPLFKLNATQLKKNLKTDYNVPIVRLGKPQQTHGTNKKSAPNEVANNTYFLQNEDNIILLPIMDFNVSATPVRHKNTSSKTSLGFQGNPQQTGGINTDLVQNNEEIKNYFSQNEKGDNLLPFVVSVTPTQDTINNSQPPFGYIQTSHQTLGINRNLVLQKEESKNIHPFNELVRNTQQLVESKRNFLPNKDINMIFFTDKEASRDLLPTMEFNVSVSPNPHVQNVKQTVEVNRILQPKKEVKSNAFTHLEDNRNQLSMVDFTVSTVPIKDTITNSHQNLGFLKNGKQSLEIHKTLLPNMEVNNNVFTHKEDNGNTPIVKPQITDTNLHRPTGFIKTVQQTVKKNRTLLTKKEVNNNVFSHKADNGSLLALNKNPAKDLNKKPHVQLGLLSATQEHIEGNKKSALIDINRNLHKSIVTKKFKKMSFNKESLLNPFEKFNSLSVKMSPPPKGQKRPIKRMKLGNRRMEVMTMNTEDFFSQHRLVTRRNMLKNRFQDRPAINKLVTSIPRHSILRPKFGTIDKLTKRFEHKMRPKPLILKHTDNMFRDQMMHHHPDIEKRHKTANSDKVIVQKIGLISRKSKINNVIDRPLWRPTEKPKFFKDRIDSIRNYLYNADNVKATRRTALVDHVADDPESVEDERRPPPPARLYRRNNVEMSTTQVTDWWLDDMYLKVRLPLPINSNPGMVFPRRHFAKMEEVADLGALFIDDLLDYKEMLDRGELPLERATSREKGQPLCMEQFYRLLGVCRIPEVGRDRLELPRTPAPAEECEELVVVACRNYFYPIPVKAADRGRLTPGEMQAQLLHAMVDAAGAPPAPRVGLLTSMNRDQWARAREQLIKDEMNRMNMELISRALCIVCLDEAGGDRADADADTNAMLRAMHGAGTRHHSANRWFDKTVQLIISSDGTIGMCYEHSAAEGVAVVRLAERALARAEVADRPAPPPALLPAPLAMKWNVTNDVQRTIEQAARDLDRAISDLDHKVYTYRGYGREYMKSCRTSPDVYIQLALQYAYYKMYGYLVTTYESASLRRFRNGRVDNIRSAHGAALAWAAAMCTAETPPLNYTADDGQKKVSFNLYGEQKKLELFEEAARKQTSIMEANILGKGLDNHLLGLREAARETLGELPPVFSDTTYKQMIEFKLSTSQVSTTTDGTFMGYGAVCPDGYGCSYNPKKDSIIFCLSSFTSSSVTNTEAFLQSLEEALDSMKLMFQARKAEN